MNRSERHVIDAIERMLGYKLYAPQRRLAVLAMRGKTIRAQLVPYGAYLRDGKDGVR